MGGTSFVKQAVLLSIFYHNKRRNTAQHVEREIFSIFFGMKQAGHLLFSPAPDYAMMVTNTGRPVWGGRRENPPEMEVFRL